MGSSASYSARPHFSNILEGFKMGKFDDALSAVAAGFELPDEVKSTLTAAYQEDLSSADAKVTGLESMLAEKDTLMDTQKSSYEERITNIKAANWDALRSGPPATTVDKSADSTRADRKINVHDLFKH